MSDQPLTSLMDVLAPPKEDTPKPPESTTTTTQPQFQPQSTPTPSTPAPATPLPKPDPIEMCQLIYFDFSIK